MALVFSAAVKDVKAYPVNKQLWVEWTAPQGSISKYTIEWCEQCDRLNCPCEWQQEPGMSKGTFLTGKCSATMMYNIWTYRGLKTQNCQSYFGHDPY